MAKPTLLSLALLAFLSAILSPLTPAQTCPTENPAIDNGKSNKLFPYFPTAADSGFLHRSRR